MATKQHRIPALLIALLALLTLTACAGATPAAPANVEPTAAPAVEAAPTGAPAMAGEPMTDFQMAESLLPVAGAEATYAIKASPDAPPYRLVLKGSDQPVKRQAERFHVGSIEIFREGESSPLQVLDVEMNDPSQANGAPHPEGQTQGLRWTDNPPEMADIDFDGDNDLAIWQVGGAKWGSYHWWLFDSASGQFVTSPLTDELKRLRPEGGAVSNMSFSPENREIKVMTLLSVCPSTFIYTVEGEQLSLVSRWLYEPTPQGCRPTQ